MAVTLGLGLAEYLVCIYLAYLISDTLLFTLLPFCLYITLIILFNLDRKCYYWTVAHMTTHRLSFIVYIGACMGRFTFTQILHWLLEPLSSLLDSVSKCSPYIKGT